MNIIEFISQPWHWSISGVMLVVVMFLLIYLGKKFGISTSFENLCTVVGTGKIYVLFDIDLKYSVWRFLFVGGTIIGGFIGSTLLASPEPVAISAGTILLDANPRLRDKLDNYLVVIHCPFSIIH